MTRPCAGRPPRRSRLGAGCLPQEGHRRAFSAALGLASRSRCSLARASTRRHEGCCALAAPSHPRTPVKPRDEAGSPPVVARLCCAAPGRLLPSPPPQWRGQAVFDATLLARPSTPRRSCRSRASSISLGLLRLRRPRRRPAPCRGPESEHGGDSRCFWSRESAGDAATKRPGSLSVPVRVTLTTPSPCLPVLLLPTSSLQTRTVNNVCTPPPRVR